MQIPIWLSKARKALAMNCGPWSEWIISGYPNLVKTSFSRVVRMMSVVVFSRAKASGHFENASRYVKI